MKGTRALAVTFAATIVTAPMAADAIGIPTITFKEASDGEVVYTALQSAPLTGSIVLNEIFGKNTPNVTNPMICTDCVMSFFTGLNTVNPGSSGGDYEWSETGALVITGEVPKIFSQTGLKELLRGVFDGPVTARHTDDSFPFVIAGLLKDVVINKAISDHYNVLDYGVGAIEITGSGTLNDQGGFTLTNTKIEAEVAFTPVPVPAALPLLLTALTGLGLIGRRKMTAAA